MFSAFSALIFRHVTFSCTFGALIYKNPCFPVLLVREQVHAATHALVQNKIHKIQLNIRDTEINFGNLPENDRYKKQF